MDKERDVYEERGKSKNEIMPDVADKAEHKSGLEKNYAPSQNPESNPAPVENEKEITGDAGTGIPQEDIDGAGITGSEEKKENGKDQAGGKTTDKDETDPEAGQRMTGETNAAPARPEDNETKTPGPEAEADPEVGEEGATDGVKTGEETKAPGAEEPEQNEEAKPDDQEADAEVMAEEAPLTETEKATTGPEAGTLEEGEGQDIEKADEVAPDKASKPATATNKKEEPGKEVSHDPEGSHEEESDDDEEGDDEEDYGSYSKQALVKLMDSLVKENNIRKADRLLKAVKPAYDSIRDAERSQALKKFIAEGGSPDDFDYKLDELDVRFDANYTLLKDRRTKHFKNIEKEKEDNLLAKNELLERLRKLVDEEETTASISALKEIQKEWRAIGQIPGQHVKNLWANYNALLDRFYDNRSIYFELKELDRKKNLEGKLELCEKAEQLDQEENLKSAIKELNELHEEFKHIGPVPKEDQEPLWQRFKTASDKVYARRREFVDHLKADLYKNQDKKKTLGDRVQEFLSFESDRINEWNKKTKEILAIQKEWEAIGGLPKDSAKEINKHFWSAFKGFFNKKSAFFKQLEGQREENLKKKQELVQKAEALKDSTDWNKTANELKKMQQDWKEIGPVPERFRNSIYHEFKKSCDYFFESKRSKNKEVVQEYDANLKKKEAICAEIEGMAKEHSTDLMRLEQLQDEFNAIGFVPKSAIKTIQKRFMEAVNTFAKSADNLDDQERHNIELAARFNKLKSSPNSNRKIHQKENELRKQIGKLENDISLWKNNLEFFADSKQADKLKEDFNEKINNAKKELKEMQDQLYIIRNI